LGFIMMFVKTLKKELLYCDVYKNGWDKLVFIKMFANTFKKRRFYLDCCKHAENTCVFIMFASMLKNNYFIVMFANMFKNQFWKLIEETINNIISAGAEKPSTIKVSAWASEDRPAEPELKSAWGQGLDHFPAWSPAQTLRKPAKPCQDPSKAGQNCQLGPEERPKTASLDPNSSQRPPT